MSIFTCSRLRYLKFALFYLFITKLYAEDLPNQFSRGPSHEQKRLVWLMIRKNATSDGVLSAISDNPADENDKVVRKRILDLVVGDADTLFYNGGAQSNRNLDRATATKIVELYPEFCMTEAKAHILEGATQRVEGAADSSATSYIRAINTAEKIKKTIPKSSSDDYDGGNEVGKLQGKMYAYWDDYYVHQTFNTIYNDLYFYLVGLKDALEAGCESHSKISEVTASKPTDTSVVVKTPQTAPATFPKKSFAKDETALAGSYDDKNGLFIITKAELLKAGFLEGEASGQDEETKELLRRLKQSQ